MRCAPQRDCRHDMRRAPPDRPEGQWRIVRCTPRPSASASAPSPIRRRHRRCQTVRPRGIPPRAKPRARVVRRPRRTRAPSAAQLRRAAVASGRSSTPPTLAADLSADVRCRAISARHVGFVSASSAARQARSACRGVSTRAALRAKLYRATTPDGASPAPRSDCSSARTQSPGSPRSTYAAARSACTVLTLGNSTDARCRRSTLRAASPSISHATPAACSAAGASVPYFSSIASASWPRSDSGCRPCASPRPIAGADARDQVVRD